MMMLRYQFKCSCCDTPIINWIAHDLAQVLHSSGPEWKLKVRCRSCGRITFYIARFIESSAGLAIGVRPLVPPVQSGPQKTTKGESHENPAHRE